MRKITFFIVVISLFYAIPLHASSKWKPQNTWTFKGSVANVFNAAKNLPKSVPLTLNNADQKAKEIKFRSDWDAMDIPKTETLKFTQQGKGQVLVEVYGVSDWYAYKTLQALGELLKQPLPEPPKTRRFKD